MLKRSVSTIVKCLMFQLALFAIACAGIDFYGFQKTAVHSSIRDSLGHYHDSITGYQYVQKMLGYSQLEISEITITPKGSYLDIVEDGWFSSDVYQLNLTDMTEFYMYKGTITLPAKAAVTGLQAWRGDTAYRAMLKPSKYISDTRYPDSITLENSFDARIALLQQYTATTYEATFTRATLGERKHARIRYILPNTGAGDGTFAVSMLFHMSHGNSPKFIKLTVLGDAETEAFTLNTAAGPVQINDTSTHMVPYQSSFTLTRKIPGHSTMHVSEFPDGPWKGNYLLLNTEITDTMVKQLSKPIQTVFVWRWNAPQQVVTFVGQIKGLSDYGNTIISQARELRTAINNLTAKGYQCGLIHMNEGMDAADYVTSALNDSSGVRASRYLEKFTEQYLYSTYQYQEIPPPGWIPTEIQTNKIETAQQELRTYCTTAARLLADSTYHYRHVILVSIGNVSGNFRLPLNEAMDSVLGPITVDATRAEWLGVDMYTTFRTTFEQHLSFRDNFYFPAFAPTAIQLRVKSGELPYSFPLSASAPKSFSISARVNARWDTLFTWTGYDDSGTVTDSLTTRPYVQQFELDSGLAKLWARDESHLAEIEEIYPGGTFGIVTKATFLQATTADITQDIANTVPFLQDNEIYTPRTPIKQKQARKNDVVCSVIYHAGFLAISGARDSDCLMLYDVSGRLLVKVSLHSFRHTKGVFRIPLHSLLKGLSHRMIIVRLDGIDGIRTFKVKVGKDRI